MAFGEDGARVPKGNGARNFALLRLRALAALNCDTTGKLDSKNKRFRTTFAANCR